MKKLVYLSMLLVLVLGSATVAAQVPEKPAPDYSAMLGTATRAGIEDISGSYATWDGGAYGNLCASGGADYLCFNYHVQSYTWSWPYGLQMHLPSGWNATNGYLLSYSCSATGYPGTLTFTGGQDINFGQTWYLDSSGEACDAVYCMDVTTGGAGPANWYISSDGYGGGVVDTCDTGGYYSCGEAVQPPIDVPPCAAGIYLSPAEASGSACEGEAVTYSLGLFNNAGYDNCFSLGYSSNFPISGPAEVCVVNGQTGYFDVEVTIPCGGASDTATVTVWDVNFSDTSTLTTSVSGGGWIDMPASLTPVMDHPAIAYGGNLYVVGGYGGYGAVQIFDGTSWSSGASDGQNDYVNDACLGLNSLGEPVIDLFGDTSEFFNVRRYNIATNSWSSFAFPAGFPSGGLWAPDIVSMLQETGQNLCYISGGATAPGGGNTNALYAYDPAAITVASLGNFSYLPTGIAFHFSWYVPWVNGICAAGGVDANSVVSGDTQCYDFDTASFNGVNADLGALPQPWWGGGDASVDGVPWGVNGVDAAFALLQKSFVWDGTGFVYGPDPLYGVYRMEADTFDGSVFAANGSTGGFSPSTLEEWLQVCEPCSGEDTLTCGDFVAQPAVDPYGRIYVRWKVEAVDEAGAGVPLVAVDAWLWSPQGGPFARTRWTHWDGFARFPWGSNVSGPWQIDVTNMTLAGYTFVDGANCTATGTW